jgi:hypothetical protein
MADVLPRPDRLQALTDAEVDFFAAAVHRLDVDVAVMVATRLGRPPVRTSPARPGDDADARAGVMTRTRREALGDHLRSLADAATVLPRPGRPQALVDTEVERLDAGIRALDVDITNMVVARLKRLPVPSARNGEDADARPGGSRRAGDR